MPLSDLFAGQMSPQALWGSQAKAAVLNSLMRARVAMSDDQRLTWRQLRDYLDGIHAVHTLAAASVTHPQTVGEWAKGRGAALRAFRLVEMVAERVSVAFHRPPTFYHHLGDGEPIARDDPKYGPQVEQWEVDAEDCELDTVLSGIDEGVNVLEAQIVSPAWVSDGVDGRMTWQVYDPQDVYIDPSPHAPQDERLARSVSLGIHEQSDTIACTSLDPDLWSTWTRSVDGNRATYGHWFHSTAGGLAGQPLFKDAINGYGMIPVVIWRARKPSRNRIFSPPDEALLSAQAGTDVSITDLFYGLRFNGHPQRVWVGGDAARLAEIATGPDSIAAIGEGETLTNETPTLNTNIVRDAIEWSLRLEAISRSLPADIFSPSPARNLAALQEMRLDLRVRRERTLPHYIRALRRTWEVHKAVGNYWARAGAARVIYSPELQLGVKLAEIPKTEDRWQAAQSNQVEISQGLTDAVSILADREGVSIEEAQRRVDVHRDTTSALDTEGKIDGAVPVPARPDGDQPRPASVERS